MSIRSTRKSHFIGMSHSVRVCQRGCGSVFRNVLPAGLIAADRLLLPVSDFVTRAGTWRIVWTSSGIWCWRWRIPRNRDVQHVLRGRRVNVVCAPSEPRPTKSRLGVPPRRTTDRLFAQVESHRPSAAPSVCSTVRLQKSPPPPESCPAVAEGSASQPWSGHRTSTSCFCLVSFP